MVRIVIPPNGRILVVSHTGKIYIVSDTPNGGLRIEPVGNEHDESRKKQR